MRSGIAALIAMALAPALCAQESDSRKAESAPATAEGLIAVIEGELKAARDEFFIEYRQTKSDDDKTKLYEEKYPKPEKWFPKLYDLAKASPKSEGAEVVLLWIVAHGGRGNDAAEALEILARDHIESKSVGQLADVLAHSSSPKADELLKALEERNPNREVKGRAVYARAQRKRNQAGSDAAEGDKDVEAILERVQKEFADVESPHGGTLGERAGADLFEIRNLAIGKVAPELTGEGVDGKPLKLSDFKGKVVVLDFWGHW